MATPSTPAKINVYKLVGSPKVPTDAMKKAGPLGQGIIQGQKAQLTALNRIGTTLNSIQGSLKGFLDIETRKLKAVNRQGQKIVLLQNILLQKDLKQTDIEVLSED